MDVGVGVVGVYNGEPGEGVGGAQDLIILIIARWLLFDKGR